MVFRFFLVAVCFLIFSCDLPNEANTDCNGISFGAAFIDECGRCVGEGTGFVQGYDMDDCDVCFGIGGCGEGGPSFCGDINAINYVEIVDESIDNDLCIYDLCLDYIFSSVDSYECDESDTGTVYQEGDQLRCTDVLDDMDLCFPDNCGETFNLSKLYGKVSWIELTASW